MAFPAVFPKLIPTPWIAAVRAGCARHTDVLASDHQTGATNVIYRYARTIADALTGPLLAGAFIFLLYLALISPTSAAGFA